MKARIDRMVHWWYVKRLYGPRCKDFEPGCAVCKEWADYDSLWRDKETRV